MGCPLRIIVVAITITIASICLLFSMRKDKPKKVSLLELDNEDESEYDEDTANEDEKNGGGTFQQIAAILTGKALLDQYCRSRSLSEAETKATEAVFASMKKRPSVVTALVISHIGVIIGFRNCPYFGATIVVFGILLACLVEFFSTLQIKPSSGCPYMFVMNVLQAIRGNPKTKSVATQTHGNQMFSADELSKHNGLTKPTIYLSIKGVVYDVSTKACFYGPNSGRYHMLAGNEASRPLAVMSSDICQHVNGPISEITTRQTRVLKQWVDRFNENYTRVGYLEGWHANYQGRTITLQPKQKRAVASQFDFGAKFAACTRALSVGGM